MLWCVNGVAIVHDGVNDNDDKKTRTTQSNPTQHPATHLIVQAQILQARAATGEQAQGCVRQFRGRRPRPAPSSAGSEVEGAEACDAAPTADNTGLVWGGKAEWGEDGCDGRVVEEVVGVAEGEGLCAACWCGGLFVRLGWVCFVRFHGVTDRERASDAGEGLDEQVEPEGRCVLCVCICTCASWSASRLMYTSNSTGTHGNDSNRVRVGSTQEGKPLLLPSPPNPTPKPRAPVEMGRRRGGTRPSHPWPRAGRGSGRAGPGSCRGRVVGAGW